MLNYCGSPLEIDISRHGWGDCNYWKGSWAGVDWKCPTFLFKEVSQIPFSVKFFHVNFIFTSFANFSFSGCHYITIWKEEYYFRNTLLAGWIMSILIEVNKNKWNFWKTEIYLHFTLEIIQRSVYSYNKVQSEISIWI